MKKPIIHRAMRALAAVAAVSLMATACDDDPIIVDDEPETERVVLTIGSGTGAQVVTWNTLNASVAPATVTIPAGQSRAVTAQFLRADGSVDPIVNANDFRLDFTVASGTGVTVTKTGSLAATLAAGSTVGQSISMTLSLFHVEDGHHEYGPSNAITVTVQ